MGDDKKLDRVPEGVPDPLGGCLAIQAIFGCIGFNFLGGLGLSYRVLTELCTI